MVLTPRESLNKIAAWCGSKLTSEARWCVVVVPSDNRRLSGSKELRLSRAPAKGKQRRLNNVPHNDYEQLPELKYIFCDSVIRDYTCQRLRWVDTETEPSYSSNRSYVQQTRKSKYTYVEL